MAMPPIPNITSSSGIKGHQTWGDTKLDAFGGGYKASGHVYNFGGSGGSGVKVSTPVVVAVAVVVAVFFWSKK